jgi:hypothetical protein
MYITAKIEGELNDFLFKKGEIDEDDDDDSD